MSERSAAASAWQLVLAAGALAHGLDREGRALRFAVTPAGELAPVTGARDAAVLAWQPDTGWTSCLPPDDPRAELLNLYLPVAGATAARPVTIGHLGQSLDGFIATHEGDSQFVTGDDNIVHLHRMRALCDAVVVGAGTVAADDPRLTTRLVPGPSPLRVVFDPGRRLGQAYQVFEDGAAPTLYVCGRSHARAGETAVGHADLAWVEEDGHELAQLVALLRARGCARIFIEGGGVTVSAFLEANLLDRLQIAIAPLLIGDGRPAIRLAPHARLRDCRRPSYRVFRMGGDVLFDCELTGEGAAGACEGSDAHLVTRII